MGFADGIEESTKIHTEQAKKLVEIIKTQEGLIRQLKAGGHGRN